MKLTLFLAALGLAAQDVPPDRGPLNRRYEEGEKLNYRMKGVNESWRYEIQAAGVVNKDSAGKYFEEYAWSNLKSDGAPLTLPPASAISAGPVT